MFKKSVINLWILRKKNQRQDEKGTLLAKKINEVCALRFVQLTSYYTFKKSHWERFWNSYLFEAVCVFLCDTVFWCVLLFVRVDGCVSHVWAHTKIAETAKKKKKKKLSICFCHVFFYSEQLFNRWNLFIKTINDYLSLLNIKAFII